MISYEDRGVSPHKPDVKKAISGVSTNIFPGAFCWIIDDILSGDPSKCIVSHADGAGTKSSLAYLYYRETQDPTVFRGIAKDSLAMNLNDLVSVGATGPYVMSNTIGRNAKLIGGDIISEIISGYQEQCEILKKEGIAIKIAGGETADLGDVVRTTVIDTTLTAQMKRADVIDISKIRPGLSIIGLASYGQSTYEDNWNSGIGTNGFSSLRHDLLSEWYKENYPESFSPEIFPFAYKGRFRLSDIPAFSDQPIGSLILSPTRIYAPVIKQLLKCRSIPIEGIINNSGGGQTKCLSFGKNIKYIKDNMIPPPPIFNFLHEETNHTVKELTRTYNLGTMMEIYVDPSYEQNVLDIAKQFNIDSQIIGRTEYSSVENQLHISLWGEDIMWNHNEL